MNCESEIRVFCDSEKTCTLLTKLFQTEDTQLSNNRATYSLRKKLCENNKDSFEMVFEIKADDCVALRAMLSSISKTLSVFEKTNTLVDSNK